MSELKCPHCGKVFEVEESEYLALLKQVKDKEYNEDIKRNKELLEKEKEVDIKSAVSKIKEDNQEELEKLKDQLRDLKDQLSKKDSDNQLIIKDYQSKLEQAESNKKLELKELELNKEKEINELKNKNETLIESHKKELNQKEEMIAYYRDLKTKMSTKLVGETLEEHCMIEFNKVRMAAFPNAYFEKDNTVSKSGSKGDFIFRETNSDGVELISIMFEMKNENDTTATKHKNEDFLKELDKDRNEKGCEYAVLVSMLEADNDYYNAGIVDMSYRYPKMYVVRPQCFIAIITILRYAALNSLEYKTQLEISKKENIDITNFEERLLDFKKRFSYNYNKAHDHFAKAIEEIDKTIDHLIKVKESLLSSDRQLKLANDKADDLSIKKLVKDNPTMEKKFKDIVEEVND